MTAPLPLRTRPARNVVRYTAGTAVLDPPQQRAHRAGAVQHGAPIATSPSVMFARPPAVPAAPPPPPVRDFTNFAEYLRAVVKAATGEGMDRRLQRAPTGLNEGAPADGGFLVPEVWANDLIGSIYATGQVSGLCDRKTTTRPLADVELPAIDESSRADGSRFGGVLAYWSSEAATISSSFPRWRRVGFSGKKIIGIGYATGEMMADSGDLFEGAVREAFAQEIAFALDHCVLVGSGAGQPEGVVAAPCTISVAKETGQAAATIVAANVLNMYDRLVADCRANAAWFVNPDCDPQLRNLALVVGTAGAPLWSWNSDGPYPRLLGLPVIPTEHNPALGTVGDIVLGDFSQYTLVDQAPKDAVSFDAAFLSDQVIFRMTYRVDGKGKYHTPITPANSSTTRSPFITLATRA